MSYENWERVWRKQLAPRVTVTREQLLLTARDDSAAFDRNLRLVSWRMFGFGACNAGFMLYVLLRTRTHHAGVAWQFLLPLLMALGLITFAAVAWWRRRGLRQSKVKTVRDELDQKIALCRQWMSFTTVMFRVYVPLFAAFFPAMFWSIAPWPLVAAAALIGCCALWDGYGEKRKYTRKLRERLEKLTAVRARFAGEDAGAD